MTNLTIVLPTKNSEKFLETFLDSLKEQDFQNFFLFVADSSSSDNTITILKRYDFNLTIISTMDKSAEDGINKCLERIRTEYFAILNSDDMLGQKNYISNLVKLLQQGADVAFPNLGSIVNGKKKFLDQKYDFSRILTNNVVPDIGWIAKSIVLKEGFFTEKYKVATAYHFLLRLYKMNYVFKRDRSINYFFRMGGNSYKAGLLGYSEGRKIAIEFGSNKFLVYKRFLINFLKFVIKYKILKLFFSVKR
jgi:glycosyltransferase involved in cell wall biosynthesis